MADNAVAAALREIDASLAIIEPQHEGLRDFARLNLQQNTLDEVENSIRQYDRRVGLLNDAQQALEALIADGHPVLDPREVMDSVLHDLQANAATIEAALAQFASNAATALALTAADPKPKK